MAEPLKNYFNQPFVSNLLNSWSSVINDLNKNKFEKFVFQKDWESLELKERMSRLAEAMGQILPTNFPKAANILKQLIDQLEKDDFPINGFEYMFIPEFIEKNGMNHLKESLDAFERVTQFTSCEFAIRPFIIQYESETMKQMLLWSKHSNENVRRFSSEGCRPRLPWAMALPTFKKDPSIILPILENLKADESHFVRNSVANNLNDISKDNPEIALKISYKWFGQHDDTDWIIKHASRTLLKAGNPKAMELFGYASIDELEISELIVNSKKVSYNKPLSFEFKLNNKVNKELSIRMEYAIYFMKNNGKQAKKVFKISERNLTSEQSLHIKKDHRIVPISTRKYYSGEHGLAIIINGIEFKKHSFLLNI